MGGLLGGAERYRVFEAWLNKGFVGIAIINCGFSIGGIGNFLKFGFLEGESVWLEV